MFEVLLFYLDLELQTQPRVGKNKSLVLRSGNSEWNCPTQNAFFCLHKNCIHQLFLSYHVSIKDSYHLIFTWTSRNHSVCSLLSIGQVENRKQLPRHLRQRKSVSALCLLLKSLHFLCTQRQQPVRIQNYCQFLLFRHHNQIQWGLQSFS